MNETNPCPFILQVKSFQTIFGEYFKMPKMYIKPSFFQTFNFVFSVIDVLNEIQIPHDKFQAWFLLCWIIVM